MGKTQDILSFLPPLYKPYPRPSVLFAVANAAGVHLQEAENLLALVRRAHWVDFADRGASDIRDLAHLAALYDLQPRDDEDVETFREHLKGYIRTYLEGSATVTGVLELAASTLALSLQTPFEPQPDDPEYLVETTRPGDDATFKLFGFEEAKVKGPPARPAQVFGLRDLSDGADLATGRILQIAIDKDNIATVDLSQAEALMADLWAVTRQVNSAFNLSIAGHDARTLTLTSGVAGPDGEIQLGSPEGDAADTVLGVAARDYRGHDNQPAQIVGAVDHAPAGGLPLLNLSQRFFLRLAVDGGQPVEINCAGADPTATTLAEVVQKINDELGQEVASHDDRFLTLTSPTADPNSRLELSPAPAHDARDLLLGTAAARRVFRGTAAAAAFLPGRANLSLGVDLSERYLLRLRLNGGEAQEIDCRGDQPDASTLIEIAERINAVLLAAVATHDGLTLTLTSPTTGADSRLEVLESSDPEKDAMDQILGIAPRVYNGTPAGPAELEALQPLSEPLDLRHQRRLWLRVDGGSLLVIDCADPGDPTQTTLQHIVDAINDAADTTIASHEDGVLRLQSPSIGTGSSLELRAPLQESRRTFYTRGRIQEDAATMLFGFAAGEAEGVLSQPARLTGRVDLSRGADLRIAHSLRLQLDDREAIEVRVANPDRPMVTLLPHLVDAINAALDAPVASEEQGRLMLVSPTEGPQSRLHLGTSTASDAAKRLLGLSPGGEAQGRPAEQVKFVGLTDLSAGLDVSTTHNLRLRIDGRPLTEIDLQAAIEEGRPPILSARQIGDVLNEALRGDFASHNSRNIILTSATTGTDSQIHIELAPTNDATAAVFGLTEPRSYVGLPPTAARLAGQVDLSNPIDLSAERHLSLEIDGRLLTNVDCAGSDPAKTTIGEVMQRLNDAFGQPVAGQVEGKLVLISPNTGAGSHIKLHAADAADARQALFGDAPPLVIGEPGQPAVLAGKKALNRPVDLSARSLLQLRLDNGDILEVDCAGENPAKTFPDEVVDRLNEVFPGVASVDDERQIVLTSPWRVELLAQRYITLFEYAPVERETTPEPVHHGVTWTAYNEGVRAEPFNWTLHSLSGVDRPRLTNRDNGVWLQVAAVIPAGFTLCVWPDQDGSLLAEMTAPGRAIRNLTEALTISPAPSALVLPAGESRWGYSDCYGDRFDAAIFSNRPRPGRAYRARGGASYFAGGERCKTPGVFNQSHYHDPDRPGTETGFGTRLGTIAAQATSAFHFQTHLAGQFELRLPADLPPQFGGRFNQARFTGKGVIYEAAIFDLPEDPLALDEQVKARPSMVTAGVALVPDPDVPVYVVPFLEARPLTGGTPNAAARAYLQQPGVPGYVEIAANDAGLWGNLITITAPDSADPGAFDISVTYTGQDVFENAIPKVAEQVALARAAGVQFSVTRK